MCTEHCPGCLVHKKDSENRPKTAKSKVEKGVINDTLHMAIKRGVSSVELTRLLKEGLDMYSLDIHENTCIYYACLLGNDTLLETLISSGYEV